MSEAVTDKGLIYLASPYSHIDTNIRDARFHAVCRAAARFMAVGCLIFSPIAHTHPIAMAGQLPTDWEFWKAYDRAMLDAASHLWVLMLPGAMKSRGVLCEIQYMESRLKPIRYVYPTDEELQITAGRQVSRAEDTK